MANINLNGIPVFGWVMSFVWNASLSVPFYICWTCCGIGETYFYWLPAVYQSIPFWSCVGLFISVSIIGSIIGALSPRLAIVSSNSHTNVSTNKKEDEDARQSKHKQEW